MDILPNFTSPVFVLQKLVVENVEVLTQMRTSFDKPDHMAALFKRLTCKCSWNCLSGPLAHRVSALTPPIGHRGQNSALGENL